MKLLKLRHTLVMAVFDAHLPKNDENVAFYVSGCIARNISHRRKYSCFKAILLKMFSRPHFVNLKLTQVTCNDRPGWCSRSHCIPLWCDHACYVAIAFDEVGKGQMMTVTNQCSAFPAGEKTPKNQITTLTCFKANAMKEDAITT